MKIRSAIMISGALALMLVSGCQSSPEPESAPAPGGRTVRHGGSQRAGILRRPRADRDFPGQDRVHQHRQRSYMDSRRKNRQL